MQRLSTRCVPLLAAVAISVSAAAAAEALPADTFAIVGPVTLSALDFRAAFNTASRSKFYHSKPPEAEVALFQREVGDELVNRVLVVEDARRRGIKPDAAKVAAQVARYEERAKHAPNWEAERERMRAAMTTQFENQDRYEQVAAKVRAVPDPTEAQLRDYFNSHKDLFVEPEKVRVSVLRAEGRSERGQAGLGRGARRSDASSQPDRRWRRLRAACAAAFGRCDGGQGRRHGLSAPRHAA